MRLSKHIGKRVKETPKDAELTSHVFLVRGGYIKQVASGIFSLLPLGKKIVSKIENIIRQEMNKIEGQEILMPVVMPRELWEESGRWTSVGKELLRIKDRLNHDFLLGMTHEEASVHIARSEGTSYKQFPFMLYQIQTKFRDEQRSRGGLIRVREFTMKDAYSYHTSQQDLEKYYETAHAAYENIFRRSGLKRFRSVKSDTGMMGGTAAHEFMAISDAGEDTIIFCNSCTYIANREIATAEIKHFTEIEKELKEVHTPNCETIIDVANYLNIPQHKTAKAFFVRDKNEGSLVFALIRGDLEINEAKLKNALGISEIIFADTTEIKSIGAIPGFASPLGASFKNTTLLIDPSITKSNNLVCGANKVDYHFENFNFKRDIEGKIKKYKIIDLAMVREGDACPQCGAPLEISRGIEVGNIFQLGTKYTVSMNHTYLDKNGKAQYPLMGCYGIGIGRLMASVIEQSHDKFGPIWPITISPYEVHLNALNYQKNDVKEKADSLYNDLLENGIDIIFDDTDNKAGFQFNDADLIGVPLRLIISPKTIACNEVEFKNRETKEELKVPINDIVSFMKNVLKKEYQRYE